VQQFTNCTKRENTLMLKMENHPSDWRKKKL